MDSFGSGLPGACHVPPHGIPIALNSRVVHEELGPPFASALLLVSGCDDSLGLAAGCRAEMREVRDEEGTPESVDATEFRGNHVEQWLYFGGSRGNRSYTFEWGDSFGSCRVSGPTRFMRGSLPQLSVLP